MLLAEETHLDIVSRILSSYCRGQEPAGVALACHETRGREHEAGTMEGTMKHEVIWTFYLPTTRNATTKDGYHLLPSQFSFS